MCAAPEGPSGKRCLSPFSARRRETRELKWEGTNRAVAMENYIRFQTALRCGDTGRPLGVFYSAGRLEDSKRLPECMREYLRETLVWFNDNLTVPSPNEFGWRCMFWFRPEAKVLISRIWDLVAILEEEGICVRKIRTTDPGNVIYSDRHQVAAVPKRRRSRQHHGLRV